MGDRLKNRFKGISTPNIDEDLKGINDIIKATREGNFSSPYIHSPEKIEGTFIDAPRKREADSLLQGLTRGAVSPFLGAYQELGQSGDAFKQGKIGSGIADLLKGTLHTAMTPVTAPLGAVFEGLKGTGKVGGEVAKGLEQTMNLPFDAIKQGSELVKQVVELSGIDISDSETSKKFNDLAVEVGGLIALGKGHREAKKYVESKVPELKQVKNTEAEIDIKPVESKPVEGLTQEKLPNEILKPELKVEKPIEQEVLYHGTKSEKPFSEFKAQSYGTQGEHSYFYFSDKPNVLDKMTKSGADANVSPVKGVIRATVDMKKPLDLTEVEQLSIPGWMELFKEKGINLSETTLSQMKKAERPTQPRTAWQMFRYDMGEIHKALLDAGYDGIKWQEWGGTTTVALSPKQIKILDKQSKTENLNLNISPKRAVLYQENKIAIKEILDKEGLLTPEQISRRLTSLKEQGKIRDKVSVGTIRLIADEIKAGQEKPKVQEFKATPNSLDIALPEEMNSTRAVAFDRRSGLTVKEVLEQNPEFKPYVKDLKDIDEVTTNLNSLFWKKRHKEPLPELPKTEDVSFDFGENAKVEKPIENVETTSVKREMMNERREFRGEEPLKNTEVRKQDPLIEDAQRKIESGELDPVKAVQEIIDNPRRLKDSDVALLQVNARRLENESNRLLDLKAKETDPIKQQEIAKQQLLIDEEYNQNNIASKQLGTDAGRTLGMFRVELKDDYTRAPLMQRARLANKGEVVPEEVRFKLEELSKEIVDKQKLFDKEKDKVELLKAEKVLLEEQLKQRTEKRTVKKEVLDSEYENLIKEFASTMQLNVLVDPKQIQLMTKMALNRLQKGELTMEQIVDQVYQATKQYVKDLTKEDVMTAISGAGRFIKMTEPELQKRIRDIKKAEGSDQAKLQKSYKTRLENRRKEYENMLETGNFEKTPKRKTQMTPELLKLRDEVDVLKQRADREIRLLELKNRSGIEKTADITNEIVNIPRTMKASFDLSAPFRQGIILMAHNPKLMYGKEGSFREMFRYFGSDKALRDLQRQIEDSPNASLYIKSKLYLANEKANIGRVQGREEAFISSLPEKFIDMFNLPNPIKASNRAYAGFLDKARMDNFDYHVEQLQKSGVTFESNPKLYKDLAKYINIASGRGTLGGFERSANALSMGLFSPRLIAARLQFMNPANYFKLEPYVRKMWMKDMLKFVGAGTSLLTLGAMAGAEVETNPTSTDFGKMKIGNTRVDVWGGFQQYGVAISRLAMGSVKDSNGKIRKLDGKQFPFQTRYDVAQRFAEQKLSPAFGFMRDLLKDKTFMGEDFKLSEQALDLMTPLYLKDLYEAAQEDNIEALMLTIPAGLGIGVQTYKQKKSALK